MQTLGRKRLRIVYAIQNVKLKELVATIDENAFLSIENVHEVYGKRYKK